MKKIILVVCACLLLAGCDIVTDKGDYKEGVYTGYITDEYNNEKNTAMAVIVVDSNGKIINVYLDSTYTKNDVVTTKKALGHDYAMQSLNPNASGEWYEQIEKLEAKIIEKQGLSEITLDEDGYTDTVSGCTIIINSLYKSVEQALTQAKK